MSKAYVVNVDIQASPEPRYLGISRHTREAVHDEPVGVAVVTFRWKGQEMPAEVTDLIKRMRTGG